jgi:ribosome-associated translation inhibitor RaiA
MGAVAMDETSCSRSSLSVLSEPSSEETPYRLHRRFDRLGRLYGDGAVTRLMNARVVIFGLGGVGGFAAEALARSAVGHLMLVDFDDVCVTNSNRQIQALKGTIGQSKAILLRDRLRLINPQATVEATQAFYNAERSEQLLTAPWGDGRYTFVVDCIDNLTAKGHLQIQGPDCNASVSSDECHKAISMLIDKLDRMLERRARMMKSKRTHQRVADLEAALPESY